MKDIEQQKRYSILELIPEKLTLGLVMGIYAGMSSTVVMANPQGATVVQGNVTFNTPNPQTLQITNSPNAIINWQQFSIQQNELTQFIQQNANSAVLNRITGQDPSQILGQLRSNGRVFLINPNGIVFGHNAVVDTAGLIASTLNMSNTDFLEGKLRFQKENGIAGDIENNGVIHAGENGDVYLIAPNITNNGIITIDNGNLLLAAGEKVVVTSLEDTDIAFEIQAPENEIVNLGDVVVKKGTAAMFAGTLRHEGSVEANNISMDADGNIVLSAQKDITVTADASLKANGANGGNISVQSEEGITTVAGTVAAEGSDRVGGSIEVLGDKVAITESATINASGTQGGGEILVGGDYQGKGATQTAEVTFVGKDTTITADATESGDGGKVIVWADDTTRAYGAISSRGGANSGNGGFVEVSGKETLDFNAIVDTGAANGLAGTLLLDPSTLTITDGAALSGTLDLSLPNLTVGTADSGGNTVSRGQLEAMTTSIVLEATGQITINDMAGDVIDLSGVLGNSLTIRSTTSGGIAFTDANDQIKTYGGAITLEAQGTGTLSNIGKLDTGFGGPATPANINLTTANGDINLNNQLIAHNANGTANITVSAGGSGKILQANASDLIHGGVVTLSSGAGMSNTANTRLRVQANTIDVTAGTDDALIQILGDADGTGNGGTVQIKGSTAAGAGKKLDFYSWNAVNTNLQVAAAQTLQATGDADIYIDADDGNLLIDGTITSGGAGNILLNAGDSQGTNQQGITFTAGGTVTSTSGAGYISLNAADMSLPAGSAVQAGTGNVYVRAGGSGNGSIEITDQSATGDLVLDQLFFSSITNSNALILGQNGFNNSIDAASILENATGNFSIPTNLELKATSVQINKGLTMNSNNLDIVTDAYTGSGASISGANTITFSNKTADTDLRIGDEPGGVNLTSAVLGTFGNSDLVLKTSGTADVILANYATQLSYGGNLTLDASAGGKVQLNDDLKITAVGRAFTTNSASGTEIKKNIVTQQGAVTINGNAVVTNTGTSTIDTTDAATYPGGASVSVTGTLNGQTTGGLIMKSGNVGTAQVAQCIGCTTSLSVLNISGNIVAVNNIGNSGSSQNGTTGSLSLTAAGANGKIQFNGGDVYNSGIVTLNAGTDGIHFSDDLSIRTSATGANAGAIYIEGGNFQSNAAGKTLTLKTVDSDIAFSGGSSIATDGVSDTLSVDITGTSGDVTLLGVGGAGNQLKSLNVDTGGTLNINGEIDVADVSGTLLTLKGAALNIGAVAISTDNTTFDKQISLVSDNFGINAGATINSGAASTLLTSKTLATAINLGGGGGNELTDAELDTVTGTGVVQIGEGTQTGGITINGTITHAGATQFGLQTAGNITFNQGAMTGLNITGDLTLNGGVVGQANAGTDAATTGTLTISTPNGISGAGALETSTGTLSYTNAAAGTVNIQNTGSLNITNFDGGNATSVTLTNDNSITSSATMDINSGVTWDINGSSFTNTGTIKGLGTLDVSGVTGGLVNNGIIQPGQTGLGKLSVTGNVNMGTGTIEIDTAGSGGTAGTDFDQLAVSGNVTNNAGATLSMKSTNSLAVNPGDTFAVVTCGGACDTGALGTVNTVTAGDMYSASYAAGGITATLDTVTNSWTAGVSGDFSTAANWSRSQVPTTGHFISFNPGSAQTITLNDANTHNIAGISTLGSNGTLSVTTNNSRLNFSGASSIDGVLSVTSGSAGGIGGAGNITINSGGSLILDGTTIDSTGTLTTASGSTTTIAATGTTILTDVTWNNAGTVTWPSGGGADPIDFGSGSTTINNQVGGIFNLNNDVAARVGDTVVGAGTFNNAGVINATNAADTRITANFNNSGTVNVDAGSLQIEADGTDTAGVYDVDSGATLQFETPGTRNIASNIQGVGNVVFNPTAADAVITHTGTYNITGSTTSNASSTGNRTVNLNGTITSLGASFTQSGNAVNLVTNIANGANLSALNTLTVQRGTLNAGDANMALDSASVTNSVFNSNGAIVINNGGTFVVDSATIGGSSTLTTNATSTTTLADGGQVTLTGKTWNNAGAVTLDGDTSFDDFTIDSVFNNSGTFNLATTTTGTKVDGTGAFTNTGSVVKTGASEINIAVGFTNSTGGSVAVNGGAFTLTSTGTFTHAGTYNTSAGTTLEVGAGTHTFNGAITNAGLFKQTGASTSSTINTNAIAGDIELANGALNINANSNSVGTLTVSNGTLGGSGDITTTGAFTWEGGTISATGANKLTTNAATTLQGSGAKTLTSRTWDNNNTVTWTTGDITLSDATAIFNNKSGATFDNQSSSSTYDINGSGAFNNLAGAIYNQTNNSNTYFNSDFVNAGTVNINDGYITFKRNASYTHTGDFNIAAGKHIRLQLGTHTFSGTITNGGYILNNGATSNFNTVLGGDLQVTGGQLNVNSASTVASVLMQGGTLGGTADITVTGLTDWQDGIIEGNGANKITTNGGTSLTTSFSKILTNRTWENNSTATWTQGDINLSGGSAVLKNLTGKTFDDQTSSSGHDIIGAGTFNNQGTFTKSSGTASTVNVAFNNSGNVTAVGADIEFYGDTTQSAGNLDAAGTRKIAFFNGTNTITGGTVTGAGDFELGTGSTTNINTALTLPALNVNGGNLGGSGDVTISGVLDWQSGTNINNVDLFNTQAVSLQANLQTAGNLNVTSNNAITQAGQISVGGDASFATNSGSITLSNAANVFTGSVGAHTNVAGADNIDVTDSTALSISGISMGSGLLTLISGGDLVQTGAITTNNSLVLATVGVGGSVGLGNTANTFALLQANATAGNVNNLSIGVDGAYGLAATTVDGVLNLSASGNITQTANVTAGGTITLHSTGGSITQNDATVLESLTGDIYVTANQSVLVSNMKVNLSTIDVEAENGSIHNNRSVTAALNFESATNGPINLRAHNGDIGAVANAMYFDDTYTGDIKVDTTGSYYLDTPSGVPAYTVVDITEGDVTPDASTDVANLNDTTGDFADLLNGDDPGFGFFDDGGSDPQTGGDSTAGGDTGGDTAGFGPGDSEPGSDPNDPTGTGPGDNESGSDPNDPVAGDDTGDGASNEPGNEPGSDPDDNTAGDDTGDGPGNEPGDDPTNTGKNDQDDGTNTANSDDPAGNADGDQDGDQAGNKDGEKKDEKLAAEDGDEGVSDDDEDDEDDKKKDDGDKSKEDNKNAKKDAPELCRG